MKMIILHEKYTNNPITIRLDAIDNITETVTVSLGNYSIDVSEDITTIMDKIKEAEGSVTLEHMRDATPEEQKSTKDYIKSISKPTGFHFDEALTPQRPKGKWIEVNRGIHVTDYRCSECGRIVRDDTGYDVTADYPYCHCGAEMGGTKW